jgi:hypothetical protein
MARTSTVNSLREKAKTLRKEGNTRELELASILYTVYTGTEEADGQHVSIWRAWGFGSWRAYVKDELNMDYPTALDYVRVWEKFGVELGGMWNKKFLLPLNKMRVLCEHVTEKNVTAQLQRAQNLSVSELQFLLQGGRGDRPTRIMTFTVLADASEELKADIEAAKKLAGCDTQGEALPKMVRFVLNHKAQFRKELMNEELSQGTG